MIPTLEEKSSKKFDTKNPQTIPGQYHIQKYFQQKSIITSNIFEMGREYRLNQNQNHIHDHISQNIEHKTTNQH